ncbi:beta-propeller fold lactonase family protein [Streptomyces sp. NPDC053813]|uniref:beta-propeller fold lactonase family protein n=1 Tax=Streptomyces sp. NPDC053813 TaxID=3365717 RepID=UPI0037D84632
MPSTDNPLHRDHPEDPPTLSANVTAPSQTITGYHIRRPTGTLSVIGHTTQGVSGPTNFVIDTSGQWLYVNNSTADNIAQFAVALETGELKPTGRTTPVPIPLMMALHRSDRHGMPSRRHLHAVRARSCPTTGSAGIATGPSCRPAQTPHGKRGGGGGGKWVHNRGGGVV